jgi:hypothetical protein
VGIYNSLNVEIGTEAPIFLFWEYLFQIFGILSLQCTVGTHTTNQLGKVDIGWIIVKPALQDIGGTPSANILQYWASAWLVSSHIIYKGFIAVLDEGRGQSIHFSLLKFTPGCVQRHFLEFNTLLL